MIKNSLLSINDLCVSLENKSIINNLNLNINSGEVHIIMGPNGAGKSTLARVLAGEYVNYNISGSILFDFKDLLSLSVSEISLYGMFLSFQNPIEIQGVSNVQFFKSFLNFRRKHFNMDPIDNEEFLLEVKSHMKSLNMKDELLHRDVNYDFSGGEKKKNEILQLLLLNPKLSILDEVDSGLDVDSLKNVFMAINNLKSKDNSILIITHYSRISEYIDIDFVHIMNNGSLVKTGKKDLLHEINTHGYFNFN